MMIDLRFEIDCDPDTAWAAIHSTQAAQELYGSVIQMRANTAFPDRFSAGEPVTVDLVLAGLLRLGRQSIRISDESSGTGFSLVRTMHDTGGPIDGPLSLVGGWHHRITITPSAKHAGRSVWRDRLRFSGPCSFLVWPVLWAVWAWRAHRVLRLAPGWRTFQTAGAA